MKKAHLAWLSGCGVSSRPLRDLTEWSRGDSNPRAGAENDCVDKDLEQADSMRAAKSGANGDEKPPQDPDLTLIIERWEHLPEDVRSAILVLVKSVEGEGE